VKPVAPDRPYHQDRVHPICLPAPLALRHPARTRSFPGGRCAPRLAPLRSDRHGPNPPSWRWPMVPAACLQR